MDFGEKFKKLVNESGKSYDVIASELGLRSRSSVSHYMKSSSLPKHDMLVKMCSLFDVPMSFFEEEAHVFRQNEISYDISKNELPILSDESSDGVKVGCISLPHTGITDGFAIIVTDGRLENIGIPAGSTVILSRKFVLGDTNRIIVQKGNERFFAKYEKIRENYARIIPANPELAPVMYEAGKTDGLEIYAVVQYILYKE